MKISIIIPCYNCSFTIRETLESLVNQVNQNFEVICINDGSNDDTLSVLKKWQENGLLDIKIIDKENAGVSAARNDGMKIATGKYILFLDADDGYHKEYIERLVGAIEKSNADIAYCKLDRKFDNIANEKPCEKDFILQNQTEAMNNLMYRMGEFGFYCYIYKRDKLNEINLEFDVNTKFGEDREFIWKYICHCETAAFVDMKLYWYRVNEKSATHSKPVWRAPSSLGVIKRVEKYLIDNNCKYAEEYISYMYSRVMWGLAKTYAIARDKELFNRLRQEYDVKSCMKKTKKDKNKLVSLASRFYLVHPSLFYFIVGLKK